MKKKPACVAISDIHFKVDTLEVASAALKAAIDKANKLRVPLVIAGDLNDTKAIIRAEVANRIIRLLEDALTPVYILEGNHDKVNEKGDEHGLNYLRPYATIVDTATTVELSATLSATLIPYQNSVEKMRAAIKGARNKVLIVHQGVLGAQMGDYVVDTTSIDPKEFAGYTVYSGHYHRHQTVGPVTYLGSPYTITFGEANDGVKGFLIINEDGSFDRHILDLRAHRIYTRTTKELAAMMERGPEDWAEYGGAPDLVWLKITGPKSELEKVKKSEIAAKIIGHGNFKLDKIYTDADAPAADPAKPPVSGPESMDAVIDATDENTDTKAYMKKLWREIAP